MGSTDGGVKVLVGTGRYIQGQLGPGRYNRYRWVQLLDVQLISHVDGEISLSKVFF